MSPAYILVHLVTAIHTVDFTDARTACLATRYTAHTARMVAQPIGVSTPTAMTVIAKLI